MSGNAQEAPLKQRKVFVWMAALAATVSLVGASCGKSDSSSGNKADKGTTTAAADGSGKTTTTADDTTTTAADAAGDLAKLSGKLDGQGSSFQDTFEQQVSKDFADAVKSAGGSATVTYTKTGSSDGKKALADQTVAFAGSDSPIKPEEMAAFGSRKILYFPIIGGPIAVAYNLKGVDKLNLSADTIAGIFGGTITSWDDEAVKKDNPDAKLPSTAITVVHRSDGSGTTSNFTKFLKAAAPNTWKLDAGETVNWPSSSGFQGGEKSTGVTSIVEKTDGAIGYADLADAAKANLSVASVGNAAGDFVAATPDAASAALAGAKVADDLTYNPLNVDAKGAYPITSPTWILVDAKQKDAATADAVKGYLSFVLTTGQEKAKGILYAPLPDDLTKKAIAQIDQITTG